MTLLPDPHAIQPGDVLRSRYQFYGTEGQAFCFRESLRYQGDTTITPGQLQDQLIARAPTWLNYLAVLMSSATSLAHIVAINDRTLATVARFIVNTPGARLFGRATWLAAQKIIFQARPGRTWGARAIGGIGDDLIVDGKFSAQGLLYATVLAARFLNHWVWDTGRKVLEPVVWEGLQGKWSQYTAAVVSGIPRSTRLRNRRYHYGP